MKKINDNSILYFIRKYNDLDHVTPLLYSICGKKNTLYLCSLNTHQNFEKDYRIHLLKKKFKQVIFLKYDAFFKLNFIQKFKLKLNLNFKNNFFLYYLFLFLNFFIKIDKKLTTIKFSRNANLNFNLILFDHFNPENFILLSKLLIKLKRKTNKIFCLPHGFLMYQNPQVFNLKTNDFKIIEKYADKIFVASSNWYKIILKRISKKNKLVLIGSLRFTDYWRKIIEKQLQFSNGEKIDILFFGSENSRFLNLEKYQQMFDILEEYTNLNIVFKPSTRTNLVKFVKIPDNINISRDHSLKLIRNSKLIIANNTSVIFDVLFKNKFFISPRFLRPKNIKYDLIHEKIRCCYVSNSIEEFKFYLKNREYKHSLFLGKKRKLFNKYIYNENKTLKKFINTV